MTITKTRVLAGFILLMWFIIFTLRSTQSKFSFSRYSGGLGGLSPFSTAILGFMIIYKTDSKKYNLDDPEQLPDALTAVFMKYLGWMCLVFVPLLTVLGTM